MNWCKGQDILYNVDTFGLVSHEGEALLVDKRAGLGLDVTSNMSSALNVVEDGLLNGSTMAVTASIIEQREITTRIDK